MKSTSFCQVNSRLKVPVIPLKPLSSHIALNLVSQLYRVNISRYDCFGLPLPSLENSLHRRYKGGLVFKFNSYGCEHNP